MRIPSHFILVLFPLLGCMGCATGQLTPGPDVSALPRHPEAPTVIVGGVVDHRADPGRLGWAKSLEYTLQGNPLVRAEREIMKALHSRGFNVVSASKPSEDPAEVTLAVTLERLHVEYFEPTSYTSPLFESPPRHLFGSGMFQGTLTDSSGQVLWRHFIYQSSEKKYFSDNQDVMNFAGDILRGCAEKLADDPSLQEAIRSPSQISAQPPTTAQPVGAVTEDREAAIQAAVHAASPPVAPTDSSASTSSSETGETSGTGSSP